MRCEQCGTDFGRCQEDGVCVYKPLVIEARPQPAVTVFGRKRLTFSFDATVDTSKPYSDGLHTVEIEQDGWRAQFLDVETSDCGGKLRLHLDTASKITLERV